MPNMTLAIPEDLHEAMRKHQEIKWSEVARQALRERVQMLDVMDRMLTNSRLSEKDALKFGRLANKGIAKRHGLVG